MMKNIMKAAAIALAALTIASCTGKKFQVNGTISDAKDSLLYFENMSLQEGVVVLDSVKLGENGEFSFSEAAPEAPEFYRLRIANQIINISIDSTETVTVPLQLKVEDKHITFSGETYKLIKPHFEQKDNIEHYGIVLTED